MGRITNADGTLESESTNVVTLGFARKLGRENYGNEEASLFYQVVIEPDDDLTTIEDKVRNTFSFMKGVVYSELGVEFSVGVGDGVVRDAIAAEKPKAAAKSWPKRGGAKPAPKAASNGDGGSTADLWESLLSDPSRWWDNREDKGGNPKRPDFKHKDSGDALWLDSKDTPDEARIAYGLDATRV